MDGPDGGRMDEVAQNPILGLGCIKCLEEAALRVALWWVFW